MSEKQKTIGELRDECKRLALQKLADKLKAIDAKSFDVDKLLRVIDGLTPGAKES